MEKRWLFVGPIPLSGIGQVVKKYADLMNGTYITYEDILPNKSSFDITFCFLVPSPNMVNFVKEKFNPDIVMTVCETWPVNENYRQIFDMFDNVVTPSQFCSDIFRRQFSIDVPVIPHHPGSFSHSTVIPHPDPYVFYTIGNIADPRKNIKMLIEAFIRCNFGNDAKLVLKATCLKDVHLNIPNIHVINGLVDDESMNRIHNACHCYVSCSHSEGVGMGAVEAAVRDKPVIIADYGGLKEYVKTPFVIRTTPSKVGIHDFLFTPDMEWGQPSLEDLVKHMKECFEKKITHWNHEHTREFTSASVLRAKLSNLGATLARSSV